jgi:hypothetical protein
MLNSAYVHWINSPVSTYNILIYTLIIQLKRVNKNKLFSLKSRVSGYHPSKTAKYYRAVARNMLSGLREWPTLLPSSRQSVESPASLKQICVVCLSYTDQSTRQRSAIPLQSTRQRSAIPLQCTRSIVRMVDNPWRRFRIPATYHA